MYAISKKFCCVSFPYACSQFTALHCSHKMLSFVSACARNVFDNLKYKMSVYFFSNAFGQPPCNLHSTNQRTEAELQILVASFRFSQASQLTTRAVTYIRFIYLCSTFSISAFINEETSIGVSKVTSSSCQ